MENSQLAQRILRYLEDHPNARDTVEGITEWWLLQNEIQQRLAEVEAALGELVQSGLVIADRGAGRAVHYRLKTRLAQESALRTNDD